jgi:unsaturated chondroitin disaccharide hydrolase
MSLELALQRIDRLACRFPDGFPSPFGNRNRYHRVDNVEWTPGFWTGLLWLAHQQTGEREYREHAMALIPSFAARLDAGGSGVDTHDLGFLYTLSCNAAWTQTGSAEAHLLAVRAADLLAARYWKGGRVIQAWSRLDDPTERGRIIIDSTMNVPLLFSLAVEGERSAYRDIAVNHLDQCARLLVRPDGSTYHTCFVDTGTGKRLYAKTHQGRSDESCWARGQAWGIYGFALAYQHTRLDRFRETARQLAWYFLDHLSADGICCWDLELHDDERQERDTSAAAIAASSLIELSELLAAGDPDRVAFRDAATTLLDILTSRYFNKDPDEDGILRGGVCHHPQGQGVNECCLWGDYFYVEAMARQNKTWSSFW